jgi:hypothetical protein
MHGYEYCHRIKEPLRTSDKFNDFSYALLRTLTIHETTVYLFFELHVIVCSLNYLIVVTFSVRNQSNGAQNYLSN